MACHRPHIPSHAALAQQHCPTLTALPALPHPHPPTPPPSLHPCRTAPPSPSTSPCLASCWASCPCSGPLATCASPASCAPSWRQPAWRRPPRSAAATSSPCWKRCRLGGESEVAAGRLSGRQQLCGWNWCRPAATACCCPLACHGIHARHVS